MHKKIMLAAAAVAAVMACVGASSASAATLYTTAAKTTPVAVNTVFTATTPETDPNGRNVWWYIGAGPYAFCKSASYTFKVTQNSGGVFKASVTNNTYVPICAGGPSAPIGQPTGTLQISGGSVANGAETAWLGTTLTNTTWVTGPWNNTGNYTGAKGSPPANGAYAQQPTAAKAPISIVFDRAPSWINNATAGTFSATYKLTGAAAAWSLG
jgi:hypothetical protein